MCIFVATVEVGRTKIAVARYADGKRQFIMYENVVSGVVSANAMILPIPADASSVELIDMSTIALPWDLIEDATPKSPSYGTHDEYDLAEFAAVDDEPPLEVVTVGGYRCSIAPGLADIKRSLAIEVPANIEEVLRDHYAEGYCFLICQFGGGGDATTAIKMHPIAYSHDVRPGSGLFLPTRHAHGGGGSGDATTAVEAITKRAKTDAAYGEHVEVHDYDHILYLINATTLAPPSTYDYAHRYFHTRCTNLGDMIPDHGIRCPIKFVQKVAISAASHAPNGDQWAE